MDLIRVEWRGGMSCAWSSGGAGARDPSSRLASSFSTCSSSTYSLKGELGKGSRISGDWTKKSTGESGATTGGLRATTGGSWTATKGICTSSGKRSKTDEEDREAQKWENLTKRRCSQKTTLWEIRRRWETGS